MDEDALLLQWPVTKGEHYNEYNLILPQQVLKLNELNYISSPSMNSQGWVIWHILHINQFFFSYFLQDLVQQELNWEHIFQKLEVAFLRPNYNGQRPSIDFFL